VFIEAWEHAREYDAARGTVRSWLFVRLRSRALDRLGRAERVRSRSMDESEIEVELQRATSAPGTVEVIAVNQALEQLPTDVREVLDLTYFEGLTAREIAERVQVPIGTVRSRLARGLATLSVLLRRDEGVDDAG
jgi:RNA polymerase sigma-70 factor (ECF subfamily)